MAARRLSRSRFRARETRESTVPRGTCSISAASWWVNSPTTTRSRASRKSCGNCPRACCILVGKLIPQGIVGRNSDFNILIAQGYSGGFGSPPIVGATASQDGDDPRPLPPFGLKRRPALPSRAERLLDQVFRLLPIADPAIGHAVQGRAILVYQAIELGQRERQGHFSSLGTPGLGTPGAPWPLTGDRWPLGDSLPGGQTIPPEGLGNQYSKKKGGGRKGEGWRVRLHAFRLPSPLPPFSSFPLPPSALRLSSRPPPFAGVLVPGRVCRQNVCIVTLQERTVP